MNNNDNGISFMDIESLLMPSIPDNNKKTKKKNTKLIISKQNSNINSINNDINFENLSENKVKNEFDDNYIDNSINNQNKVVSKNNNNDEYLERYDDVRKYPEGSYHPIDFDYHSPEAFGISSKYLNKNSTMIDGLRKNGILCDFSDFEKYNINNPITEMKRKFNIRLKACNCNINASFSSNIMTKTKKAILINLFLF